MGNRVLRVAGIVGALLTIVACGETVGPAANVHLRINDFTLDSTGFADSGVFVLGLVPTHQDGSLVSPDSVTITATTSTGSTITVVSVKKEEDPRAIASVILLDNSASLFTSDPTRQRASAAKLMWSYILGQKVENQVSLLDFSARPPTNPPFLHTRILQDWTSDTTALNSKLNLIQSAGVQGTPLFGSLLEVLQWEATERPIDVYDRSIIMLTDGLPDDAALEDSSILVAARNGIVVHTVGLGPASNVNGGTVDANAVAVVSKLAAGTGGVYAAVTDANSLNAVFQRLAAVVVQGRLSTTFKLDPPPPSGTTVTITVTVTINGRRATATYSFIVP